MMLTRATKGFSLIEVMCAIAVLGVGLVGLTEGVTTALNSSKEAELQTTAGLIAAGRLEAIRAEGYVTDGEDEGSGGDGLDLYRWKQTITSTRLDGLHEVQVVVEHAKTGRSIFELRTLVFQSPSSTEDSRTHRQDGSSSRRRDNRRR